MRILPFHGVSVNVARWVTMTSRSSSLSDETVPPLIAEIRSIVGLAGVSFTWDEPNAVIPPGDDAVAQTAPPEQTQVQPFLRLMQRY